MSDARKERAAAVYKLEVDSTIRRLWVAYRNLSDHLEPDDWSDEDCKLWGLVTMHSAVPSRLEKSSRAVVARGEQRCEHPWHSNPALITPCPECGEGSDESDRTE